MMKALRAELYQDHVCYRQEAGYRFYQSYPLPTPSMVRGLVHRLMGHIAGGEYIPLRIGIQGEYESLFVDMQRWDALSKKRMGFRVKDDDDHTLSFWEELTGVKLILYIAFKNDNDENLLKLLASFNRNTVVLGRNEDIARLDKTEIVELMKPNPEAKYNSKQPLFAKIAKDTTLPVFHLPFAYVIKGRQRIFKYVDALLVDINTAVIPDYIYADEPIFLLELGEEDEREVICKI
jgi:CRISPR-associated protein Cas5t